MKYLAGVVILSVLASGCAGLRPLPRPQHVTCGETVDIAALARCIGAPDPAPRESGFRSTLRIANGDLTRRFLNQSLTKACNRRPWPGFVWFAQDVPGAAPLRAFIHEGREGKPVVIVVHGIFDSNSNRYVRYAASALAEQGFGVVVPDMRWHGCLYQHDLLATAGLDEAADLVAWGKWLQQSRQRPVGLLGFSLGALDTIHAMARPEAVDVFSAGAVAISPPGDMSSVVKRLDRAPYLLDDGGNWMHVTYFRTMLKRRARTAGIALEESELFGTFLDHIVRQHAQPFPKTRAELIEKIEPRPILPRVKRPLLIIAATNDPVMMEISAGVLRDGSAGLPSVAVIVTPEGGHTGHLGRDASWVAEMLAKFFTYAPGIPPG